MQSLEECDVKKRINGEISRCFTFKPERTCKGAGGRKLRQVCVWCPNYRKGEGEKNEKNH